VTALVSATTGATVATYEYGPFGEVIRATGPMAKVNPFLFSTKYYDWETGLYYYGYRYYNPSTGRWLSKDPIQEEAFDVNFNPPTGFVDSAEDGNDYLFVRNDAIMLNDAFGLCVTVKSGAGTYNSRWGTVAKHRWNKKKYPPATDVFTLTCPVSMPYLVIYGLGSSPFAPYSPFDSWPSGWGVAVAGGPGTYTFTVFVPSSTTILGPNSVSGVYVQGCCSCANSGRNRIDPPSAPPPPPPDWPHQYPVPH
jgi:RHS repeat-associated protein